ncbi:MAG: tetratricopeptide repeat protein [Steroidobacteraceae bacterium]
MRWIPAAAALSLAACATSPGAPSAIDAGAATLVAETALERGDCRTASEEYARAAGARAAPVATIERALAVALDCQQFDIAGRIATVLREREPASAAAARLAGVVALREGRNAAGAGAFRDAARLSGDAPDKVLADLIEASADAGNDYGTYRALRAAVDPRQLDGPGLVRLGMLAFESYVYRDARALAEAAIARDPESADAQRLLSQVLAGSDDADGALRAAEAARRADPKGQVFAVAETLIQLDRIEEARIELERLLQDDDAGPQAERRLALLAFREGDIAEAAGRFSTRLRTGDDPAEALYYLGALAERHGDKQAALGMYKRLVEAGAGMIARQRAAAVLMRLGNREDAFAMLDEEGADKPQAAVEIAITKAALLRDADAASDALPILDAALGQFPGHPDLAYQRALTLDSAGRESEALAGFEALYRARPEDPALMNALGYTLADHGKDLARAHRLIDAALALTPDNPAILDSQGWVRFRRGEAQQALVPLARAYRLSRDTEIAAHWGEVLWSLGREGEARAVWARAVARDPESHRLRTTIRRFVPAAPP